MTTTDTVIGAIPPLIAIGILSNVATNVSGRARRPRSRRVKRRKRRR